MGRWGSNTPGLGNSMSKARRMGAYKIKGPGMTTVHNVSGNCSRRRLKIYFRVTSEIILTITWPRNYSLFSRTRKAKTTCWEGYLGSSNTSLSWTSEEGLAWARTLHYHSLSSGLCTSHWMYLCIRFFISKWK